MTQNLKQILDAFNPQALDSLADELFYLRHLKREIENRINALRELADPVKTHVGSVAVAFYVERDGKPQFDRRAAEIVHGSLARFYLPGSPVRVLNCQRRSHPEQGARVAASVFSWD
jgi:hypothetical protein